MTVDDFKANFAVVLNPPTISASLCPDDWQLSQPPVLLDVPHVIVHHIVQPAWAVAREDD